MGNAFSSAVTAQKREEVNAVIADVMNCFLLRFLVHYKYYILTKYVNIFEDEQSTKYRLAQAPAMDAPLCEGIIGKQRDWIKSWAERYVIVRNEVDIFSLNERPLSFLGAKLSYRLLQHIYFAAYTETV